MLDNRKYIGGSYQLSRDGRTSFQANFQDMGILRLDSIEDDTVGNKTTGH